MQNDYICLLFALDKSSKLIYTALEPKKQSELLEVYMKSLNIFKPSTKIAVLASIIAVTVVITSLVTVFASGIPCMVVDGEESYSFTINSTEEEVILDLAVQNGMPEMEEGDILVEEGGKYIVKRSVDVSFEETDLTAYEGETVEQILNNNEVVLNEKDIVTPELDTIINTATEIDVQYYNEVLINYGAKTIETYTYDADVQMAYDNAEIAPHAKDIVKESTTDEYDLVIEITKAKNVELYINGEPTEIYTHAETVGDLLTEENVVFTHELETVNFDLDQELMTNMNVRVELLRTVEETIEVEIEYDTVTKTDSSEYQGTSYVESHGENGVMTQDVIQTYIGDEVISTEVIGEEVTKEPVDEVVVKGTKQNITGPTAPPANTGDTSSGNTFVDYNGNVVEYLDVMVGESTAYTAPGGITSMGWDAQVGIVAVNPNVIPYGTKLYITSNSVVYGYAIAGDTGGALLYGNVLVDLYYDTLQECYNFGRRDMTVYILD